MSAVAADAIPVEPSPLIRAALRGEWPAWPADSDAAFAAGVLRCARHHGVAPLLDLQQRRAGDACRWPDAVRRELRNEAVVHAQRALASTAEVDRILRALAAGGRKPLLLKGTGLAFSHYAYPALRPRADIDVLIEPADGPAGARALHALGYRRIAGPAGRYVGYQIELARDDPAGVTHTVDLHWRISNAQSFAWLFTHAELAASAVGLPALGHHARRLGDAHALAVALLHRAGNNCFVAPGAGDRLIWLYDIHLLAAAMRADDRARFLDIVAARRVVAIAIDGLRQCAACLGCAAAEALANDLEGAPHRASGADLLRAGRLHREWIELHAMPTAGVRVAYLARRILPTAEYMRESRAGPTESRLPALHFRRWASRLGGDRAVFKR